jgi:hypothetical protein
LRVKAGRQLRQSHGDLDATAIDLTRLRLHLTEARERTGPALCLQLGDRVQSAIEPSPLALHLTLQRPQLLQPFGQVVFSFHG